MEKYYKSEKKWDRDDKSFPDSQSMIYVSLLQQRCAILCMFFFQILFKN